jgi:hypothetical protein
MIEFVFTIILFFATIVFVVVFLRKDIFYEGGDGNYVAFSQGTCQNGVRYEAFKCEPFNDRPCIDSFGNLTYDIVLKPIVCVNNSSDTTLNSNIPFDDMSATRPDLMSTTRGMCLLDFSEDTGCIKSTKGKRKVIKDCTTGCVEKSIHGVKVNGGVNLDNLIIGKKNIININGTKHTVVKINLSKYTIDGVNYNYYDAHMFLNHIEYEEDCEVDNLQLPRCEEEMKCIHVDKVSIIKRCEANHLEEGVYGCENCKDKCKYPCIGFDKDYYNTLEICDSLKFLFSGIVNFYTDNEYLTCNIENKIYWIKSFNTSLVKEKGLKLLLKIKTKLSHCETLVNVYCVDPLSKKRGWWNENNEIEEYSQNKKDILLKYQNNNMVFIDKNVSSNVVEYKEDYPI